MSSNIKPIEINTSTNVATTFLDERYKDRAAQQIGLQLFSTVNDVALIACHFVRDDPITGVTVDNDLTGAVALRATLVKERKTGAEVYVQQVVFNSGIYPDNEDLSQGRVTWLLPIISASLVTFLGTDEFVDIFIEFTWLDAAGNAQTLGNMPFRVTPEGDTGAIGTPPPSDPTYITSAIALTTFVKQTDYLEPTLVTSTPFAIPDTDGIIVLDVDTDTIGSVAVLNLPASAGAFDKMRILVNNLGSTFSADITPDGADEINSVNAAISAIGPFKGYDIKNTPAGVTSTEWAVVKLLSV